MAPFREPFYFLYKYMSTEDIYVSIPTEKRQLFPIDRSVFDGKDIYKGECLKFLIGNAIGRIRDSRNPYPNNKIPMRFPLAEHYGANTFPLEFFDSYGNLFGEYNRLKLILTYERRFMPVVFSEIIEVLRGKRDNSILEAFFDLKELIPTISNEYLMSYSNIILQQTGETPDSYSELITVNPLPFEVIENSGMVMFDILNIALDDLIEDLQSRDKKISFIALYNWLKDPLGRLESIETRQLILFDEFLEQIDLKDLSPEEKKYVLVQIALESSFLSLPGIESMIEIVRYERHQELPYIYMDMEDLYRGEASLPKRVIEIFKELIFDNMNNKVMEITPIAVSFFNHMEYENPQLFLVDGNNRFTAILLMRYLVYIKFELDKLEDRIGDFIQTGNYCLISKDDLIGCIKLLKEDVDFLKLVIDNCEIIECFSEGKLPALLVSEADFMTVNVYESNVEGKIVVNSPAIQIIINSYENIKIAPKSQSHGRAVGNGCKLLIKK